MSLLHRKWLVAGATLVACGLLAGATMVVCGLLAGSATASPVPSGFEPGDLTAANPRDWWLDGTVPCRLRHGCVAMIRTLNAGRSFVRVHVPMLVALPPNLHAQFAFADSENGYIAGARFWDSHDGGRHWQSANLGGQVGSVATGGGFVYATVWRKFPRAVLMRSPVGHDDWTVLAEAFDGFEGVTVERDTVMLDKSVTLGGEQQILISHDQGANFTYSRPVSATSCSPMELAKGVVWMLCRGGMMAGLYRSTNGGLTFSPPPGPTAGSQNSSGVWPDPASLGAANGNTAVIGSQEVFRTIDGGRVFKRVRLPLAAGSWDVTFLNARRGLALGLFGESAVPLGRLYYTTNAGATYHLIRIR
jgi:hypothetical protein